MLINNKALIILTENIIVIYFCFLLLSYTALKYVLLVNINRRGEKD